jgi:hypothetical protein
MIRNLKWHMIALIDRIVLTTFNLYNEKFRKRLRDDPTVLDLRGMIQYGEIHGMSLNPLSEWAMRELGFDM